jgi:hypothetical protein
MTGGAEGLLSYRGAVSAGQCDHIAAVAPVVTTSR